MRLVPGAVETDHFQPGSSAKGRSLAGIADGRTVVGVSSKLVRERGVMRVLAAFDRLMRTEGRWPVHLLGVGENLGQWLIDAASEFGCEN